MYSNFAYCITINLFIFFIIITPNHTISTEIILSPCHLNEVVTFFNLVTKNKNALQQTVSFKTSKNGDTKITLSYTLEEFSGTKWRFYLPKKGDYDFHETKDYGTLSCADYNLYKGNIHNDGKTSYILIYKHSGSGNFSDIIKTWTLLDDNTLVEIDSPTIPEHCYGLADPFIITDANVTYLRFIEWKQDEQLNDDDTINPPLQQIIHYYMWKEDNLILYKTLPVN